MRFFVDENETDAILPPLRATFPHHTFAAAREEGLGGIDDLALFVQLAERSFDALITRDKNQLSDTDERAALIRSGLHWIGHREPEVTGQLLIASISAAYIASMPHIIDALPTVERPHSFHVTGVGVQIGQRVKIRQLHLPT